MKYMRKMIHVCVNRYLTKDLYGRRTRSSVGRNSPRTNSSTSSQLWPFISSLDPGERYGWKWATIHGQIPRPRYTNYSTSEYDRVSKQFALTNIVHDLNIIGLSKYWNFFHSTSSLAETAAEKLRINTKRSTYRYSLPNTVQKSLSSVARIQTDTFNVDWSSKSTVETPMTGVSGVPYREVDRRLIRNLKGNPGGGVFCQTVPR